MCSGSKMKLCRCNSVMVDQSQEVKSGVYSGTSVLLELSAMDNLDGFKHAIEDEGFDVDEASWWYGRRIGSRKMGVEERTPLMIASLYGSFEVLKYIVGTGKVDVNRACGSDGATALHFAAASGLDSSVEVVELLRDASADFSALDVNGNRPGDLISPKLKSSSPSERRKLEMLLRGSDDSSEAAVMFSESPFDQKEHQESEKQRDSVPPQLAKEGAEKKEYPVDVSLPDINTWIYSTDEFRMYTFKVKPCSRAYSHDWTECPFVHPGENARRRDPRKYQYTCVPCPEFRKGNCAKGDNCEFAHGVFESWLHPAQYRTRLCKDETGCSRKVCFFAHKPEELRPLYAYTGSALPSPKSLAAGSMDMTPPMSPSAASSSSMAASLWQNKVNLTPPALQLPGSRLKTALNARELELGLELLGLESLHNQQQRQQQLIDEISGLSSTYARIGELKPTNLDGVYGSLDPLLLSELQALSPQVTTTATTTTAAAQLQSPTALQMRQSINQFRASYPATSLASSSPVRKSSSYGFDSSGAVAVAVMNSRSAAFAKRSQSFIDRGPVHSRPVSLGFTAAANSAGLTPSKLADWGSPDGKLDWGFKGEGMSKLKKSASFGYRSGTAANRTTMAASTVNEPDVSWVHSLVKDVSSVEAGLYNSKQELEGLREANSPWVEQLYIEQEQILA